MNSEAMEDGDYRSISAALGHVERVTLVEVDSVKVPTLREEVHEVVDAIRER